MDFYLRRLQDAIATVTEDLDAAALLRHPPGKWCAAEILEHLYLTYTGTIKGFERCLQAGKPIARATTPLDRVRILLVVGFNYFPEGRKAPKNTEPRGLPPDSVRAEVAAKISAMDSIIARAQEQYGADARLLDHPILGPLRGREWCKFHWVHGNHHLKQIRRLITSL